MNLNIFTILPPPYQPQFLCSSSHGFIHYDYADDILEKMQQISYRLILCVEKLTLSVEIVEMRYDRSDIGAHYTIDAQDRAPAPD